MSRTLFLLALAAASCASDPNVVDLSFDELGALQVNALSGSARNGDPLGFDVDGAIVRWRAATSTWEHAGSTPADPRSSNRLFARCEDADGTLYADLGGPGPASMLPAGAKDWIPLPLLDGDEAWERPAASSRGEVVIQATHGPNLRVYRKAVGATTFVLANERPMDAHVVSRLTDGGDVFLTKGGDDPAALVLQAGQSVAKPVFDCSMAIAPYCGLKMLANGRGDVVLYGGGLGTRHLYKMTATSTYPAKAEPLYDLPDMTCCFNGGQALLEDGTLVARMNMGGYDLYRLYVRKPGASSWSAFDLPNEDNAHSVDLLANDHGELFTWSIQLGQVKSTGPAYRIRL